MRDSAGRRDRQSGHVRRVVAIGFVLHALSSMSADPSAQQQPITPPVPAILQSYKPVTADRLKKPEDGDWLMVRRTLRWLGLQSARADHPWQRHAAAAGVELLHRCDQRPPGAADCQQRRHVRGNAGEPGDRTRCENRRLALALSKAASGGRHPVARHQPRRRAARQQSPVRSRRSGIVALDAKTGKEIWATKVAENKNGYYMSLSPLVVGDRVMVGTSGGELGVRGFVAAYDVETGKEAWRTYTAPAPGEPGSETWPPGDQWKTGGGSIWVSANYDPDSNLAFWGTGNGGPWVGDQRPGDNLYTDLNDRHRRRDRTNQRPPPISPERLVGLG